MKWKKKKNVYSWKSKSVFGLDEPNTKKYNFNDFILRLHMR